MLFRCTNNVLHYMAAGIPAIVGTPLGGVSGRNAGVAIHISGSKRILRGRKAWPLIGSVTQTRLDVSAAELGAALSVLCKQNALHCAISGTCTT